MYVAHSLDVEIARTAGQLATLDSVANLDIVTKEDRSSWQAMNISSHCI